MTKMNELMEKLEAAETVEEINEVKAAIVAKKERQEVIAEKSAILDSFKTAEPVEAKEEPEPKTLGEYAAKHLDLSAIRSGASKSAGTGFGFKTYTDAQTSQQIIQYDRNVVDTAVRDLQVHGLFGSESISGNALKYFILGAREDNSAPAPGSVDEAAAKPQFHIVESSATATLQKIAGWFYETDELLEDNAFLASALNARGLYELDARIEAYLLSTALSASGINTATWQPRRSLIRRALSEQERSWLSDQPEETAAFARLWTRKESLVKACSTGFDREPGQVQVCPGAPVFYRGADWFFSEQSFPGAAACVCTLAPEEVLWRQAEL